MHEAELLENSKKQFYAEDGIITGGKLFEIYVGYFQTLVDIKRKEWIPFDEMTKQEKEIYPHAKANGGFERHLDKPIIKFNDVYCEEKRYAETKEEAEKLLMLIEKEIRRKLEKKDKQNIREVVNELIYQTYRGYVSRENQDNRYHVKKEKLEDEVKKSINSEIYKTFITEIKDLVIDTNETMIGSGAFKGKGLTSVKLGDKISIIARDSFAGNEIKEVKLPARVGVIGERAFANNRLTSLYIPPKVTSIKSEAFKNNQLSEIIFDPESELTYIGSEAFADNNIENLEFPKRLTRMYDDAFDGNIDYSDINVEIVGGKSR